MNQWVGKDFIGLVTDIDDSHRQETAQSDAKRHVSANGIASTAAPA